MKAMVMSGFADKINKPVVLCILDGWGHREDATDNGIKQAHTPVYNRLWNSCPRAWLATSGLAVGLPDGQMGNSEVGHMNLGSGRVVLQDLPKIDSAIETGALASNPELENFIAKLKASGGTAHVMGLLSPGGVHSHQNHIAALANIISAAGVSVRIHAFMDGRDTPPRSALEFVAEFEAKLEKPDLAQIATVIGRYYAMDRDQRWERVEKAYRMIAGGDAEHTADSATAAIEAAYTRDENDEFIAATCVGEYAGMADGDGLLMANFRADRAREIFTAFLDPEFASFDRSVVNLDAVLGMVEYSSALSEFHPILFPSEDIENSFGEILADHDIPQLRISETEKYAHVTFFFNGGKEDVFAGEDRILIPSPDVATYDLKPEMSAFEVTEQLEAAITSGKYGAIIVNYANPDMVGHTGVMSAAIKAVETVDACLGRLENAVKSAGAAMIVTADHGNIELMRDPETNQPHTAHTSFDVPVLLLNHDAHLSDGALSDIAPTLLSILGLPQPTEMTGRSLVAQET